MEWRTLYDHEIGWLKQQQYMQIIQCCEAATLRQPQVVTYMTKISLIVTLNKQFNSTQLDSRKECKKLVLKGDSKHEHYGILRPTSYVVKIIWCYRWFYNPPFHLRLCIALLAVAVGGCYSISDILYCQKRVGIRCLSSYRCCAHCQCRMVYLFNIHAYSSIFMPSPC